MQKKHRLLIAAAVITAAAAVAAGILLGIRNAEYSFSREVPVQEKSLRLQVVETAKSWIGCKESDGTHKPIIDLYNAHEPLAMDYTVQYTDKWCATFGSAVAIQCGLTDIIPTECGCERQIALFRELGRWEEDDAYIPLPGDYIFYSLGNRKSGDCTAWSDHVGIVVGTWNGYIKVIEGNNANAVRYRVIRIDDVKIRGYGLPDYAGSSQ